MTTGVLAAMYHNRAGDGALMVVALLAASTPSYWLGLMLILAFSFGLGWFPPAGDSGLRSLVLPSVTLGLVSAGVIGLDSKGRINLPGKAEKDRRDRGAHRRLP